MTYGPITELALVGVEAAGVPNQERIIIRPTQPVDLGDFLLLVGSRDASGLSPTMTHRLGPLIVQPPSWIVVYTGSGSQRNEVVNGEVVHYLYLGRPTTVLRSGMGVGIVKVAGVVLGDPVP